MIYGKQYYEKIEREESAQAERLADYIVDKYTPLSVIDFGCATGLYLKPFCNAGAFTLGLENSVSAIKERTIHNVIFADIRRPINVNWTFDMAISLETLEHIDQKYDEQAVKNIASASDLLLFSAAGENQVEESHVNLKPKSYWIDKFKSHGLEYSEEETQQLITYMEKGYRLGWFTQNAMIFRRAK